VRIVVETGRSAGEVAEELGVNPGTLHSRVSRWRRNGTTSSDRPVQPTAGPDCLSCGSAGISGSIRSHIASVITHRTDTPSTAPSILYSLLASLRFDWWITGAGPTSDSQSPGRTEVNGPSVFFPRRTAAGTGRARRADGWRQPNSRRWISRR
jgi:hypothetical protein